MALDVPLCPGPNPPWDSATGLKISQSSKIIVIKNEIIIIIIKLQAGSGGVCLESHHSERLRQAEQKFEPSLGHLVI